MNWSCNKIQYHFKFYLNLQGLLNNIWEAFLQLLRHSCCVTVGSVEASTIQSSTIFIQHCCLFTVLKLDEKTKIGEERNMNGHFYFSKWENTISWANVIDKCLSSVEWWNSNTLWLVKNMYSDWFKLVTWLGVANRNALFQLSIVMLL